mmetsp:Transcript_11206/g.15413  ORF Transcript_11206/g.15413 Transcript_11206/m.15413 type:complete len:120 (+) Transcript_11206:328-687(+)
MGVTPFLLGRFGSAPARIRASTAGIFRLRIQDVKTVSSSIKYVGAKNSGAGLNKVGCSKNSVQIEVSNFTEVVFGSILVNKVQLKFSSYLLCLINNSLKFSFNKVSALSLTINYKFYNC